MDTEQKLIRLGIVGLGGVGAGAHLPLWLKMKNQIQVEALCEENQEKLQKVSKQSGISKTYTNINDMLKQERLDAVDICTPPLTHLKLCLSALTDNVNCIVEKPFVTSVADFDALAKVAKQNNLGIFVTHNYSFTPIMRKARELLHSGEIGDIFQVDVKFSAATMNEYGPDHWISGLPGGLLGEVAPHPCHIFTEFLPGDIEDIASETIKRSFNPLIIADELKILVRTNNAIGSLSVSLNSPTRKYLIDLIGSKLWVSIDADAQTLVKYKPIPCGQQAIFKRGGRALSEIFQRVACLATVTTEVITGRYKPSEGHRFLFNQAVKALRGEGVYPVELEKLREAVRVLEIAFLQTRHEEKNELVPMLGRKKD